MNDPKTNPELTPIGTAPATTSPFVVRSFGLTDTGQVRPANEDGFLVAELARTLFVRHTSVPQAQAQYSSQRGHIFLVADGMGGHQAGEKASALTVITIEGFLLNTLKRFFHVEAREEQNVMKEFRIALLQADARIFEEARQHPELLGMGTTLTLAFALDWKLFVAHAGDSRCYLYSEGNLQQLTEDHTMVGDLVRRGVLSPEEAAASQYRNVITNALGGREQGVQVELHKLDLAPGDRILVCSDGLTGMVSDDRIRAILGEEQQPQKASERLVAEANTEGGKDNITALVARFDAA
jgi:protein phosphatase